MQRTKNAVRNAKSGMFLKFYQMFGQFILRTVMIYTLGMEYLGLSSLFTSILQVLNLAELGVGSAMVYSMYKPIVDNDSKTICALLNLYKKYYRIIGFVILFLGLIVMPFLPKLISGDIPESMNLYVLYFLNLITIVLSYWLFAYKNSILNAHQRLDIINKISIASITIQYILQIIVLFVFKNYYLFLLIALVAQILLNIFTSIVVNRYYPKYKAKGELSSKEKNKINIRIKGLVTSKIGEVTINSADSIVISIFLGLNMLAIYNNYYYIISAIMGLTNIIFTSTIAGIGNSLIVDGKEKNYNDLLKFTFMVSWIACFCSTAILCLIQPFMIAWVGEGNLLSLECVICFVIFFYMRVMNQLWVSYKDAAGIWDKDKYRPLLTAIFNLILNLILVHYIGIYGIILSTVISLLLMGSPWLLINLFKYVLERKLNNYLLIILKYVLVTIISCAISFAVCHYATANINIYLSIILSGIICLIIPNVIYILIFNKSKEYAYVKDLINSILKRRIQDEKSN
ncbi:MAG: polysaccharide biosynthesis protein [Bacilli bacterium]|nr:polysaccharide biosynthesis protein [Bacilli bacterium]